MECPTCYLEFNSAEHVPRIFSCGHTFCEMCIKNILLRKHSCPFCRTTVREFRKVEDFPKNFILVEMVEKRLREKEKFDLCPTSSKPNIHYCLDCKIPFCKDCLGNHSGHKFKITMLSLTKVCQDLEGQRSRLAENLKFVTSNSQKTEKTLQKFDTVKVERNSQIDEYFDGLIKRLEATKALFKDEFNEHCSSKQAQLASALAEYQKQSKKIEKAKVKIESTVKDIMAMDYIDTEEKLAKVNAKRRQVEEETQIGTQLKKFNIKDLPKLHFDRSFGESFSRLAKVVTDDKPYALFFGENNKLLVYDLTGDRWNLLTLEVKGDPKSAIEFNYFGSAAALETGDVLLTGGGASKSALLFNPVDLRVTKVASMKLAKKEHSSVAVGPKVYVMGGYEGKKKEFLAEVEVYDTTKDVWTMAAPMKRAKCAFAACKVSDNLIFACGGFEGEHRLNAMELYDIALNEWSILEEKLPIRLSNHACLSIEENKVMILGGGSVDGFSLDIYQFSLDTREIKVSTRMQAGRDLRNKVFAYNDEVYVVGGCKSCSGEKINLNTQQWTNLKHYSTLVNDPLDSWYLALVYQNPLLQAREQDSMFRISEKLPALETHYQAEYMAEAQDDELEENSYLGPMPGMGAYHLPGSDFEYDDGVSLENSHYGEEDLQELPEEDDMDASHVPYDD